MENAPDRNKKPSANGKWVALSLGTCILLGIIGYEVLSEKTERKVLTLNNAHFVLPSSESQQEKLQLELNHALYQLNAIKRQLFVRNKALDSSSLRQIQLEIEKKENTIQQLTENILHHEEQLNQERSKIATLETSLSALTEFIELQKGNKERVLAKDEIAALKQRIQEETALNHQGAEEYAHLSDQLSIERTLLTLLKENAINDQKASIQQLKDQIEKLQQKHSDEILALASKGTEISEELAMEKTLQALEKDQHVKQIERAKSSVETLVSLYDELEDSYVHMQGQIRDSQVADDLKQSLLFEQLENKLAQERLSIELEDLSYALISIEHQKQILQKKLDDHLAIYNAEKQDYETQIRHIDEELSSERKEKQQLLTQIADLHELKENEASFANHIKGQFEHAQEKQLSLKEQLNLQEGLLIKKQEEWNREIAKYLHEIEIFEDKVNTLSATLEQEQRQSNKLIAELRHHHDAKQDQDVYIAKLEGALKNAESALNRTAAILEDLEKQAQHQENLLTAEQDAKQKLETEMEEYKQSQTQSTERELQLNAQLNAVLDEAASLSIQIASLEENLKTHRDHLDNEQRTKDQLRQEAQDKEQRLQDQVDQLNQEIAALEENLKTHRDHLDNEQRTKDQLRQEAQDKEQRLQDQVDQLNQEIAALEENLKTHRDHLDNEQRTKDQLRQDAEDKEQRLQDQVDQLNQEIAALEENLKTHRDHLDNEQQTKDRLKQDAEDKEQRLKDQVEQLNQEIAALEENLKIHLDHLDNEKQTKDRLRQDAEDKEQRLKDQVEQLNQEIAALEENLKQHQNHLDHEQQEKERLRQEAEDKEQQLKQEIATLADDLRRYLEDEQTKHQVRREAEDKEQLQKDDLKRQLENEQLEKERLKKETEDKELHFKNAIEHLNKEIAALEENLKQDHLNHELQKKHQLQQEAEDKEQHLQNEVEQLNQEIAALKDNFKEYRDRLEDEQQAKDQLQQEAKDQQQQKDQKADYTEEN